MIREFATIWNCYILAEGSKETRAMLDKNKEIQSNLGGNFKAKISKAIEAAQNSIKTESTISFKSLLNRVREIK